MIYLNFGPYQKTFEKCFFNFLSFKVVLRPLFCLLIYPIFIYVVSVDCAKLVMWCAI